MRLTHTSDQDPGTRGGGGGAYGPGKSSGRINPTGDQVLLITLIPPTEREQKEGGERERLEGWRAEESDGEIEGRKKRGEPP